MVADQDTDNPKRIQCGLRASKTPGVTLAACQESRIRDFHETLDHSMAARPDGTTPVLRIFRRMARCVSRDRTWLSPGHPSAT